MDMRLEAITLSDRENRGWPKRGYRAGLAFLPETPPLEG